ncbi:MAG: sigma 54-interacting transcriptional regulator, partial [Victivallaceae bacterium]
MKKQEKQVKILVLAGNNIFRLIYRWYSYLVADPELILRCDSYEDALKLLNEDNFDCFICDLQRVPESALAKIENLRDQYGNLRIAVTVENNYAVEFQKKIKEISMLDPQGYCCYRDVVTADTEFDLSLPNLPNYAMIGSKFSLRRPSYHAAFKKITTDDEQMLQLFEYCSNISPSRQPVLVTGETGTGKELFARAIHEASGRSGELVVVNIAGLDDTLLSDVLFGHVKGAFTGAVSDRSGLI